MAWLDGTKFHANASRHSALSRGASHANRGWRSRATSTTGLDLKAYAIEVHRYKLTGNTQSECRALDAALVQSEAVERISSTAALPVIQQNLLVLRKRYKQLGC